MAEEKRSWKVLRTQAIQARSGGGVTTRGRVGGRGWPDSHLDNTSNGAQPRLRSRPSLTTRYLGSFCIRSFCLHPVVCLSGKTLSFREAVSSLVELGCSFPAAGSELARIVPGGSKH